MTEKTGKRAVIINNIKSGSIEQAIFILKTPVFEKNGVGSGIVAEAQEIINSYINTIEGVRPERRDGRLIKGILLGLGFAICAVGLTALCLTF